MPAECAEFLAGEGVPTVDRAVVASQGEELAIGTQRGRQGCRSWLRARQPAQCLVRGRVPDVDDSSSAPPLASLVGACRGQRLAIGEEENGLDQRGTLPGKSLSRL